MSPATSTFVNRIPLGLAIAAALMALWPAWAQLAYVVGMGVYSIAVPASMVVFIVFTSSVALSRRVPCRARKVAFYLLTGMLVVADAGLVFHQLVADRAAAPLWLVLIVDTLPAMCMIGAVAVARLTQPRHGQVSQ